METETKNNVKFCPQCGTPVVPGTKFCTNCGTGIAPEITVEPVEVKEVNTEPAAEPEPVAFQPQPSEEPYAAEFAEPGSAQKQSVASAYEEEMRKYRERQAQYAKGTYTPERKPDNGKRMPGWVAALIIIVAVLVIIGVFVVVGILGYTAIKSASNAVSGNRSSSHKSGTVEYSGETKVGDQTVADGSKVTINITGDSENLASAVYAKCKNSVIGVGVFTKTSSSPWEEESYSAVAQGSGVVYSEKGYIVTNAHVISMTVDKNNNLLSTYEIRIYTDSSLSTYFVAEIVGLDYTSDLAVLKIDAKGLIPIEVESSKTVSIGDQVFIIGCPGGIEFYGSMSSGIVGGLNRNLLTNDGYAYDLIQTTADINPGTSGGALVNREGKLIGIGEMKIVETGYEGMNFAIASDTVTEICDTLIKDGKVVRPAIGIKVNTLYDVLTASDAGLPAGAFIAEVEADSVAGKAGLKANMIITEFNGVAVYNFVSLRAEIMKCRIGDEVTIKVYVYDSSNKTGGTYKTFTLKLQSMDDEHRDFD